MQATRLVIQTSYCKIQEIMQANGFTAAEYSIQVGYPNESQIAAINKWPLITVESDNVIGFDAELGSRPWKSIRFFIDVLAKSNGQREDLAYLLWDSLNDSYIPYYNFNEGFPTVIGDYTGISKLGSILIEDMTINNVNPEKYSNILGENHHAIIDGFITLAN
jgi:hypothetical protein